MCLHFSSKLKKQRQELQYCSNYQPCRRFLEEDSAIQIIMDCRATPAVNFNTKLGFNQHDQIMAQEQSVLSRIVTLFAAEKIILQHNVLGYRIDPYFLRYKLAIEVDEQGHNDRDIDYAIRRQKAIQKELGCKIIWINTAKVNFNIFAETGKLQNYIIKSTKKVLMDELLNKLLRLEFKSNNFIKTKCLKLFLSDCNGIRTNNHLVRKRTLNHLAKLAK